MATMDSPLDCQIVCDIKLHQTDTAGECCGYSFRFGVTNHAEAGQSFRFPGFGVSVAVAFLFAKLRGLLSLGIVPGIMQTCRLVLEVSTWPLLQAPG